MGGKTPNTRPVNSVGAGVRSEINPRLQKTFDYAIEVTKQLLTLGSAVLALTITIGRVRGPLLLQIVTFALGAVFLVAYAYSVYKPGLLG